MLPPVQSKVGDSSFQKKGFLLQNCHCKTKPFLFGIYRIFNWSVFGFVALMLCTENMRPLQVLRMSSYSILAIVVVNWILISFFFSCRNKQWGSVCMQFAVMKALLIFQCSATNTCYHCHRHRHNVCSYFEYCEQALFSISWWMDGWLDGL